MKFLGTSLHGLFEEDGFRAAFLTQVAARRGKRWTGSGLSFAAAREAQIDRLADALEATSTWALVQAHRRGGGARDMILVLTNADTEILALRSVIEGLPDGFPPVRAANPAPLEPGARPGRRRPGPGPAPGRPGGVAGAIRRAAPSLRRPGRPAPGLRRGGGTGPRAHGPVDRGQRYRRPGIRIPGPRRPGQHRAFAAFRGRHRLVPRVRFDRPSRWPPTASGAGRPGRRRWRRPGRQGCRWSGSSSTGPT